MAETTTVARPYAQAAFRTAREQDALQRWSDMLELLAAIVMDESMRAVLGSPRLTTERKAELIIDIAGDQLDDGGRNLVRVLCANGRLALLPEISAQYRRAHAELERTLEATLVTAQPVEDAARDEIATALGDRLSRKVSLDTELDESLIGGAIVRAGDLVIDGSVKGRLERLTGTLSR